MSPWAAGLLGFVVGAPAGFAGALAMFSWVAEDSEFDRQLWSKDVPSSSRASRANGSSIIHRASRGGASGGDRGQGPG